MPDDLILQQRPPAPPDADRLHGDCANCLGLCCVIPSFSRSADFAMDKPAGTACRNLRSDHRCGIHQTLRESGMHGCTVYDCFGAGQQVTNVTLAGQNWNETAPDADVSAVFYIMRQLHELLWYLREARAMPAAAALLPELERAAGQLEQLTTGTPDELLALDVSGRRAEVATLLRQVSDLARAPRPGPDHANAQLIGASLTRADLRAGCLRGCLLVGATLFGADLRGADLLGADLRGADLRGADLSGALFVTQAQLDSARGDASTRLPAGRRRPWQWQPADVLPGSADPGA